MYFDQSLRYYFKVSLGYDLNSLFPGLSIYILWQFNDMVLIIKGK